MKDLRQATALNPVASPVGEVGDSKVGDILSHCAVAAREYGMPAVVGIQATTSKIKAGQRIEINSTLEIVRFLAD